MYTIVYYSFKFETKFYYLKYIIIWLTTKFYYPNLTYSGIFTYVLGVLFKKVTAYLCKCM